MNNIRCRWGSVEEGKTRHVGGTRTQQMREGESLPGKDQDPTGACSPPSFLLCLFLPRRMGSLGVCTLAAPPAGWSSSWQPWVLPTAKWTSPWGSSAVSRDASLRGEKPGYERGLGRLQGQGS